MRSPRFYVLGGLALVILFLMTPQRTTAMRVQEEHWQYFSDPDFLVLVGEKDCYCQGPCTSWGITDAQYRHLTTESCASGAWLDDRCIESVFGHLQELPCPYWLTRLNPPGM